MIANRLTRLRHDMRSRRLVGLAIAGLASISMAGCASSSDSGSTNNQQTGGFTAPGLCALVSEADLSSAVGTSIGAGVPSGVNAPSCSWQNNGIAVTIDGVDPSSINQVPFGLQGSDPHVTAVSGLGDGAFFIAGGTTQPNAELNIKKGGKAISISVGSSDVSFTQTQQETAEQAIGLLAVKNM